MDDLATALQKIDVEQGAVLDEAFKAWYPELKRIAHARLYSVGYRGIMQTTALVNDAYLKLSIGQERQFANRLQFLAYASRTLRSIVIDTIRDDRALRRGGDFNLISLDTVAQEGFSASTDVEAVSSAMDELAKLEPALAQLVEMRFFGGMTIDEIAEMLDMSVRTVQREWAKARLLLLTIMKD